jgi:hypothetical protein
VLAVEGPAGGGGGSVPVIVAVTPTQAQEVLYAESFATKLILTKVAPGSPPAAPPLYSPTQ